MELHIQTFTVHKRFSLTISRGTKTESTNILVKIQQEGMEGWGEASPFYTGEKLQTTEILQQALQQVAPALKKFNPLERQQIEQVLTDLQLPSAARAAIDMALHDWVGKKIGWPLWRLWGLDRDRIVPTSVTIGISSPGVARQRVRNWLEFIDARVLKVKLGSPEGIVADQEMLMAVKQEAPGDALLYVDANGGWSLEDGEKMCDWLAGVGVIYVEQPLAPTSAMADLLHLYKRSPLPIFVDESCFTARDIPKLADRVHGINIKLMKSGGLTEAMRMVYTAKAYGLQVMFGCYSDSCLANTAAVQLAPMADYLDLDSHLNLTDDPFRGAVMEKGRLVPNDLPGLGVFCD